MNRKVLLIVICIIALIAAGCQGKQETATEVSQFASPQKGEEIAIIHTTMGDIKVKFFKDVAPKAVENFTKLSKDNYYDGLTFHRVIQDFMIQGGDPTGTGMGGESIYGKPFEDEFSSKLHNFRGALSMANSGSNTNGSQFFIVQRKEMGQELEAFMKQSNFDSKLFDEYMEKGGTPWLDNKHTVFGQVFEGMEVVDKITQVAVNEAYKPMEDVKITDVEIVEFK